MDKKNEPFSHPRWHETLIPEVVEDDREMTPERLKKREENEKLINEYLKKANLPHRPKNK